MLLLQRVRANWSSSELFLSHMLVCCLLCFVFFLRPAVETHECMQQSRRAAKERDREKIFNISSLRDQSVAETRCFGGYTSHSTTLLTSKSIYNRWGNSRASYERWEWCSSPCAIRVAKREHWWMTELLVWWKSHRELMCVVRSSFRRFVFISWNTLVSPKTARFDITHHYQKR